MKPLLTLSKVNTKHKHLKHQKEATARERIIHITHVLNKFSGIEVLNKILMPLREHDSNIKDTFDFQEKLSNIVNLNTKALASFDVESLFMNIPVDFKMQIIL